MASLYLALHNDAEQAAGWLPADNTPAACAARGGGLGGGGVNSGPEHGDTAATKAAGTSGARQPTDEELTPLLRVLLSRDGVEADTYWLFDALMSHVKGWFDPGAQAISKAISPLERRGSYEEQRRARHAAEARSPLLVKCAYIQETLLRLTLPLPLPLPLTLTLTLTLTRRRCSGAPTRSCTRRSRRKRCSRSCTCCAGCGCSSGASST